MTNTDWKLGMPLKKQALEILIKTTEENCHNTLEERLKEQALHTAEVLCPIAFEAGEKEAEEATAREIFKLTDEIFEFACHGDYSNGNDDAFGSDEGRYMASNRLREIEDEIKSLKSRYLKGKEK